MPWRLAIVFGLGACGGPPADPLLFELVADAAPSQEPGRSRGAAWADFDDDGDPDLFVARSEGYPNMLYVNEDGRLVARTESVASTDIGNAEGATWVDVDGDRDLDLYVVTRSETPGSLFINEGGRLTAGFDSVLSAPRAASTACFADLEPDGDLDAFVIGYRTSDNVLARNDGSGRFTSEPLPDWARGGGVARACAWGDLEGDGVPELFVANARRENLLVRIGPGLELERLAIPGSPEERYSYGASWPDVDGDGDTDLFVANFDSGNRLYVNEGGALRLVEDEATPQSAASKGHSWGDFDLDGRLDLFLGSGTPAERQVSEIYLGGAEGRLVRAPTFVQLPEADTSAAVASADVDLDGDLDVFVTNWGSAGSVDRLYRNVTPRSGWLTVALQGTDSNRRGIGAVVSVLVRDGGGRRWLHRPLAASTGYAGQDAPVVHFGLGTVTAVDSVRVRWPGAEAESYGGGSVPATWTLRQGVGRIEPGR